MVLSTLNNLKLIFSEDYNISDSDYKKLSDILIKNNLTANAFEGGLIQIINLLYKHHISFPLTMNLLQDMWSEEYIKFNFIKMLSPLIKDGVIKLRKVSDDTLRKRSNIMKLPEEPDTEITVVVYASDILKSVIDEFNIVFSKAQKSKISESTELVSSKIKGVIDKVNRQLSTLNISASIESYMKDDADGEDINLIISGVSNYSLKSSEIQNKFKRVLGGLSYVNSVEAYKEGKNELFLGLSLKVQKDYKELIPRIFNILNDLEINYAS